MGIINDIVKGELILVLFLAAWALGIYIRDNI